MKKTLLIGSSALLALGLTFILFFQNRVTTTNPLFNDDIVNIHKNNLNNSPFKETLKFTKKERKALGIPPDKYYEEEYELTMNPLLGRPTPEKLASIEKNMQAIFNQRVPGDGVDNNWESRGPNNVGGRTRGLMFDPNDAANKTVFAGGVSGGLWKNNDITNVNSLWERVDLPENLNVSVITADPNNPQIFYIGTGESYTNGDVSGDGVWKSNDGGISWIRVLGGVSGPTIFQSSSNITVNAPTSIAGDYDSRESTDFGIQASSVITGDFILANDTAGDTPNEGCNSFGTDATGKIALIRRGNCTFVDKVKNAQDAGAIGVIVLNNVGGSPINMGGADPSITIPAVMISKADGDVILAALQSGNVNGSLNPSTGSFSGTLVPGIQHINDIKIKDNDGVSEVYVAAGDAFYSSANTDTFIGGTELGVFKTVDEGVTWTETNIPQTANGNNHEPNDIEIGADGTIWLSTIDSSIFGDGGGQIFSSTDGQNFNNVYTVTGADRTQIAVSSQNAGTIYVLAEVPGGVAMEGTTDGFVSNNFDLELPNDADNGISADDFTRGQAFYDLLLEVSPTNDQTLYAGGIDLFKSNNGALKGNPSSWEQISKWSNNPGLNTLNVPFVHADQHAMAFAPGDSNTFIFGNDGGVYYATQGASEIVSRNNGFITSQFYSVGVAPTTSFTGDKDYFIGGLQDNGTQLFENVGEGINSSSQAFGGDGAASFFDQDGTDQYYITNVTYNNVIRYVDMGTGQVVNINSEGGSNGSFINQQALDSNLDILYSNYSSGGDILIKRYSGIKSNSTLSSADLRDNTEFTSRPTVLEVSPFTMASSTLFVGTVLGDILKVENANTNPIWTNIETDNVIVGSISDISFGASENELFVTVHNYGVESIWYTSNGGATWSAKEGNLPDLPVKAIIQNPLDFNEVIIGTELGIWFTADFFSNTPNWQPAQGGMSTVRVTDIDLRNDNTVYVSTYGRGVFSAQLIQDPNADNDGDGIPNITDNCPNTANTDQADADGNAIGDVCQDTDGDGILDINDNCPITANTDQLDINNDGIGDVCQDTDEDGVFDANDNCPFTPNTDQKDLNNNGIGDVCDQSYEAPNNISLEITSERCQGQNNGELTVTVLQTFVNYTLTLTGLGTNLTQTITDINTTGIFADLNVGSYSICVHVDERNFEQCFEFNIDEAPALGGVFNIANEGDDLLSDAMSVNIDTGTAPYTVVFNSEVVLVTNQKSFNVSTLGGGLLEVTSAVACEGKLSRVVQNVASLKFTFGPNPVLNNLRITIPKAPENEVNVQIYDVYGKRVLHQYFPIQNASYISIPFTNLTQGMYFVKLNLEKAEMIKIIKK